MSSDNQEVAARIRAHHETMARDLERRLASLVTAARRGEPFRAALEDLARYAQEEVIPHAAAEEETLYAAAAQRLAGRALVAALTAEHGIIQEALDQLAEADDAWEAVAAGAALAALFHSHAQQENDALLSVLLEEPAADLAALLAGVQDRLVGPGQVPATGRGGQTGGAGTPTRGTHRGEEHPAVEAVEDAPSLDVRSLPPFQRHALIFDTFDRLAPGEAFILVNDHDPKPLYYQMAAEHPGQFQWEYLEQGPDAWRVRIAKV